MMSFALRRDFPYGLPPPFVRPFFSYTEDGVTTHRNRPLARACSGLPAARSYKTQLTPLPPSHVVPAPPDVRTERPAIAKRHNGLLAPAQR